MTQVPKYQAIHAVLRQRIVSGELAPGTQLPPQQDLADDFGVTLMTLRQAIGALEAEGLVWAARGKGTFVADRPVDVTVGNLSSFAAQMRAAGVALATEILAVEEIEAAATGAERQAAEALGVDGALTGIVRRRSVAGVPFCLQHSYLARDLVAITEPADLGDASLYDTIEAATGRHVAEARESITAVSLSDADAEVLAAPIGQAALLSVRTSIDQFARPFLYDEARLVGGRCVIEADRRSDRLSLLYGHGSGG